ncbi:MAG: CoA transferase [Actinobacteria bacterium]|jgi:crotonobetainyl-CoA:carnitine CoA-transferase CaiB-like acyl-CoA transferase|nr:CoA transferase [Actinomycetota bacterium]
MTAPLQGVRVIDLTRYLAGPMSAMMLGDLGADVLKIEPLPGGDAARQSGPFAGTESTYYMASNRNKRSVALDLRSQEGLDVLLALIDSADVFIENFRPGTAVAMGLAPDELLRRNPRLIYVSISGFGHTDVGRDMPGFDQTVQAMSGLMSLTGTEDSGPLRTGIAIADASTGVFAAMGILAALLERERTGKGTIVHASLMQSMIAMINYQAQSTLSLGTLPDRVGNDHPIMFPQGTFKAGDGAITIACGNEKMWRYLCTALGLDTIAEDPRFLDNAGRMKHRRELRRIIEEALRDGSPDGWIDIINSTGVPCGPVLDLREALDHPTTRALGIVQTIDHPQLGPMEILGKAVTIGDDSREIDRHPPLLGEHTSAVLAEIGFSAEKIEHLRAIGAIADYEAGEMR